MVVTLSTTHLGLLGRHFHPLLPSPGPLLTSQFPYTPPAVAFCSSSSKLVPLESSAALRASTILSIQMARKAGLIPLIQAEFKAVFSINPPFQRMEKAPNFASVSHHYFIDWHAVGVCFSFFNVVFISIILVLVQKVK